MTNNSSAWTEKPSSSPVDDPCFYAGNDPTYLFWFGLGWYVYGVVMVMLGIGLSGNLMSLLAFRKQAKNHKSYYHQLSIISSDMISMFVCAVAYLGYVYLGVYDHAAADFIQKSYLLLVFHWAWPFKDIAGLSNLILLNGTCVDRLYALYKPMQYTKLNQRRMSIGLFVVAHIVGLCVNLQKLAISQIFWDEADRNYKTFYNPEVMANEFVVFLSYFVIGFQVALLTSLIVFVILISRKYSQIEKEMQKNKKNEQGSRPVSEKTLTKLLLIQSVLVIFGIVTSSAYSIVLYTNVVPWCHPIGMILEQTTACMVTMQQTANFLVYIGISKTFRAAVMAVFKGQNLVEPLTQAPPTVSNMSTGGRSHRGSSIRAKWAGNKADEPQGNVGQQIGQS